MAYARIEEGFWTDPKIRGLSIEGKMVAAWLFTNPHRHFSGLYYLPLVLIQVEIGLSVGVSEKIIKLLEEQGFMKYSHEYQTVWVVNMLKHQSGDKALSTQQITGITNHLLTLHGCPLIDAFVERYKLLGVKYSGKTIPLSIDLPDTPIDIKSQSQSQSKSKKITTPSGNGKSKPIPLPPDFNISEATRQWAEKKGYDHLDDYLDYFRDWAVANGKRYLDWDATFRNCVRGDWGKITEQKQKGKEARL